MSYIVNVLLKCQIHFFIQNLIHIQNFNKIIFSVNIFVQFHSS